MTTFDEHAHALEQVVDEAILAVSRPIGSARPCEAHAYHSPRPSLTHLHHILPLSWGGPDDYENLVPICPTGHYSVHALLSLLRVYGGPENLPSGVIRQYGPGERRIALDGWARYESSLR